MTNMMAPLLKLFDQILCPSEALDRIFGHYFNFSQIVNVIYQITRDFNDQFDGATFKVM